MQYSNPVHYVIVPTGALVWGHVLPPGDHDLQVLVIAALPWE